ncbi:Nif11-like leader peptide family natural product precursor [Myxacorys almedinensis]|uniref:Nif11-like leader peptide family natural product n=1 Tax=Myxacorys almedinensis A TaxID=2690445 RepID=A0A8J7Z2C8_9CYAN|nr:Nif11-like leader peptide family natural product precursor [Myxacorys almedinensis]NDJ18399.1 Nif11-like leader peptide family natural product precursor [Myxacorys almedinensis A]
MSLESATRFLTAVAGDQSMREKFNMVKTPEDFLSISHQLGYCFTTAELYKIVSDLSDSSSLRRSTGVWKWLRSQQWV